MIRIETDYPKLDGFHRGEAFFHAFGNFNIYNRNKGWILFLPARQELKYENTKDRFYLSCGLFSCYFMKNTDKEKGSGDEKDV